MRRLVIVFGLATLGALGCNRGGEQTNSTSLGSEQPLWAPTTVEYDGACTVGCEEVGVTTSAHLGGAEVHFLVDPRVDDAVAQWGDCVESMLACIESTSDVRRCAEQATCPAACKSRFAELSRDVQDAAALVRSIESVYIDEGAPCRPSEPSGVQP